MNFEVIEKPSVRGAYITVVGVGGGGGNAVNNMINANLKGVDFITLNTDIQALNNSLAGEKLQIGSKLTQGLGAGSNPEVGYKAATEDMDKIKELLSGSDMVFITAGMGGGTGTGAAPVVAQISKELGALTVAVVTKPFNFEGKARMKKAITGIENLKKVVDTLITIPNDRLLSLAPKNAPFKEMLLKVDDVCLHAVKGITDTIKVPGLINLDFADVKTIMSEMGLALMGTGLASGENRAVEAAQKAISSPLLEDISIAGAKGVLINITAASNLTMDDVSSASGYIQNEAHEDANIIWGCVIDDDMGDDIMVTVIATGIDQDGHFTAPPLQMVVNDIPVVNQASSEQSSKEDETKGYKKNIVSREHGIRPRRYKNLNISEEELEIPTFLRKQAD